MAEWIVKARQKILPFLHTRLLLFHTAGVILGFLLSSVQGALHPFGAAFCAALWIASDPFSALLGALCASFLRAAYAQSFVLILLGIGIFAEKLLVKHWSSAFKLLFLCLSWVVSFPLYYFASPDSFITGLGCLSLSLCLAVCMTGAVRALRHILCERSPASTDLLCLCVCMSLLCYCLQAYHLGGVSFGSVAACFFILLIAGCRGVETAAAAIMLSAGCVFGGAEPALAGSLAICGLCACAAREFSRWGVACSFIAMSFLLYALVSPALFIADAGLAAFLYICIPRRFLRMLPAGHTDRAREQAEASLTLLRSGLRDTADVLREAAPLFQDQDGFARRQVLAVSDALVSLSQSRKPQRRKYDIQIGAAALAKPGSSATGDSMGMRHIREQLVLLLSDGMGSGDEAHRESAAAVALLGDLLSIGFGLSEALECVNRLLMQRTNLTDMFATMDVLLFDLSDGQAQFVKYGAPPSYILRGGKVHTLYAEALPAGIVREARPALHAASLCSGDTVVLMTDGAFDALGSELSRALLDRVGAANTPDDAARALLMAAREKSAADEMTVIVARIA